MEDDEFRQELVNAYLKYKKVTETARRAYVAVMCAAYNRYTLDVKRALRRKNDKEVQSKARN
jgi:hypothetical protein